jgi:Ca2+-binding EF-hand superfamily protein
MIAAGLALALLVISGAANPVLASDFDKIDKNKDGKISKAEYMAFCTRGKSKCEDEFKWYDRNNDGVITRAEFEGKMKK